MNQSEKDLVKVVFSRQATEVRAAQRAVEQLARLFEAVRPEMSMEASIRVLALLDSIDGLRREPLYGAMEPGTDPITVSNRYRWYYVDWVNPTIQLHGQLDAITELHNILRQPDF